MYKYNGLFVNWQKVPTFAAKLKKRTLTCDAVNSGRVF